MRAVSVDPLRVPWTERTLQFPPALNAWRRLFWVTTCFEPMILYLVLSTYNSPQLLQPSSTSAIGGVIDDARSLRVSPSHSRSCLLFTPRSWFLSKDIEFFSWSQQSRKVEPTSKFSTLSSYIHRGSPASADDNEQRRASLLLTLESPQLASSRPMSILAPTGISLLHFGIPLIVRLRNSWWLCWAILASQT